jgi:uncharacterized protein (PEP-CTERM system associated)
MSSAVFAADVAIEPRVSVQETYTDNIDRSPDGQEDSAIISSVLPGVGVRSDSARVTAALDATLDLRHQAGGQDEGFEALPNLNGLGSVEAIEDLFFVDATAAVSQQLLNTRQADAQSNRDTVQTYTVNPYLTHRFGGFANGRLGYTLTQVFGGSDTLSDSMGQTVALSVGSGSDFTTLLWSLSAQASDSDRSESGNLERRSATIGLQYVVDRTFSLLGDVGFQQFDDGGGTEFSSPTWQAGFQWQPGPRTDLRATYGARDDDESLDAQFTYRIGERTTLNASYDRQLTTGQERLAQALGTIGVDEETGQIIDTSTGQAFNPNPNPTSLVDTTNRTETFRLGLAGSSGRNTFSLTGTYQKSEQEGGLSQDDQEATTVASSWGRRLSPDLGAQVFANYSNGQFDPEDREDNTYTAGASLGYSVYRNIQATASYSYTMRDSSDDVQEFTENVVTVGLHMTF